VAGWDEKYELLIAYKDKFGHTRVPQRKELEGFEGLGRWVSRQREAFRHIARHEKHLAEAHALGLDTPQGQAEMKKAERSKKLQLAPDRIERLNELGFEWELARDKSSMFNLWRD